MNAIHMIAGTDAADEELVALSLEGNRDAFGGIVARYQTLVCSLAYSICGDIHFSEELAQETFTAAWRQLRNLHEPGKLKSWLCGIARNLAHDALRRRHRVPTASAEPIDEESQMSPLSPHDDAISREEETMLWTALGDLPENYREPMILFYREQESVRAVADALDISEDVVKQRLARGRILLTRHIEQALRAGLRNSAPGRAFTLTVLAALPFAATTAKAATIGAVAKGGAAKMAASNGRGARGPRFHHRPGRLCRPQNAPGRGAIGTGRGAGRRFLADLRDQHRCVYSPGPVRVGAFGACIHGFPPATFAGHDLVAGNVLRGCCRSHGCMGLASRKEPTAGTKPAWGRRGTMRANRWSYGWRWR